MLYDFIIVGGGISGLYAAYELKKKGFNVLLLEKAAVGGGTWSSFKYKTSVYELGPNTILSNSEELIALIEDLKMEDELLSTPLSSSRRYIYHHQKLIELSSNPLQLLNSGVLSILGFLRIFLEPFCHKVFSPRGLKEDLSLNGEESVKQFCERKFGFELTDVLVKTFLKGVWAGDISKLSANIALSNLVKLEKNSGSVFLGLIIHALKKEFSKKKSILSFKNGLQSLTQKIADELSDSSKFNTEVESILKMRSENDENVKSGVPQQCDYLLKTNQGDFKAKSVIIASPAYVAAKLLADLDSNVSASLASIEYAPIALCAYVLPKSKLKKELKGFGFLSADDSMKVLGSIWASELFSERNLDDEYLHISFIGGALNTSIVSAEIKDCEPSKDGTARKRASSRLRRTNDRSVLRVHEDHEDDENAEIGDCEQSQEIWNELTAELSLIYKDWAKEPLQKEDFQLLDIKVLDKAIPQLNLGHGKLIEDLQKRLRTDNPKIHLVGNYLKGVSIKDALRSVTELNSYLA
ncbi:MAG: protoporphyrinogen oxidase [Vampirovibrionia bacterium]